MFGLFKKTGTLGGTLTIDNLPECKELNVTLTLVRAEDGDTAPNAISTQVLSDSTNIPIKEAFDQKELPLSFEVECAPDNYFVDVGVIAIREEAGKLYGQIKHFVPERHALIVEKGSRCELEIAVTWPDIPLEKLGSYGTIRPSGAEPSDSGE